MENTIDTLFGNGPFSKTYFVDSNPAKIEMIEVKKINSEIKEVKSVETFDLKKHIISRTGLLSLNIRESVKSSLIVRLNFDSTSVELKYFKRGIIRNFFSKKDPNNLSKSFLGNDWVITSDEIISELATLSDFEYVSGYGDVRLVGKIGGTMIFKINDLSNIIYAGNNGSITAVFNRSISDDDNIITIEYLLQVNEKIKKIIVN
jgi:hypothetical protein